VAIYEAKTDVSGAVWKIVTRVGQKLEPGETIMIIESMKMEIPVIAEDGGTIRQLRVEEGSSVSEGDVVATLEN